MASVYSLADMAAAVVCITLDTYVDTDIDAMGHSYSSSNTHNFENCISLTFKGDIFLPSAVSDKLIYMLSRSRCLNNITLSLFNSKNTQLKRLRVPNASTLTKSGLEPLKKHNLKVLEMNQVQHFNMNALIEYLNDWTIQNLEVLKVTHSFLWDPQCKLSKLHINLMKLKNLRELDVSYSDFNYHNLDIVCDYLLNLESLNISGTRIDSIVPLHKCTQLKRLSMADLTLHPRDHDVIKLYDDILLNLKELRHLDISYGGDGGAFNRLIFMDAWRYVFKITNWPDSFPNLISLDISGQEDIDEASLIAFLKNHPDLEFLGLMTNISKSNIFLDSNDPNYRPNLKVTGTGSINQIALAMKLYDERDSFIQTCLFTLYALSENDRLGPRPDVIQLVTKQMKVFHSSLNVQVACTACLYNLTKYGNGDANLSESIPLPVLNIAVERTLYVMAAFPSHFQIQKNALLTLCNDRILQETKMDRYECAKAVLNTFCEFDDPLMERLCVAISSVVAAKMSSRETNRIGSRPKYMQKLLDIIKRKIDNSSVDLTLGFALSTLWNLTDESPRTCSAFLESDGLKLFKKMLHEIRASESVLTKILGLLNNIAEVPTLRHALMDETIIASIRSLLKYESIEISYFAAGILANLLSDGPNSWTVSELPRDLMLIELETAILSWKQADKEMVAYRSFNPFMPLLWCFSTYQCQLWALWAIQHVLMAHAQRYYEMMQTECIFDILELLSSSENTHELIRVRVNVILDQLCQYSCKKLSSFVF